jgi:DNA modification methylase
MSYRIITGHCLDALPTLDAGSVQTCVTSPPYFGLRDYGIAGQIGLEETPEQYVSKLVEVFREVRRVLRDDGALWLNLGDSYANDGKWGGSSGGKHAAGLHGQSGIGRAKRRTGLKPKDLIGIPWMVAFALRADGWYLRQEIIWHKPNPMPESVTDRCTKAHEQIFLLSKSPRYYFNADAIREPAKESSVARVVGGSQVKFGGNNRCPDSPGLQSGKDWTPKMAGGAIGLEDRKRADAQGQPYETANKKSVWTVATKAFKEAHFATFPEQLIEPCILAGSREGDTVLDPFNGAATTGVVALKHGRSYVGVELNPENVEMSERRLAEAEALAKRARGIAVDVPRFARRQIETPLFGEGAR